MNVLAILIDTNVLIDFLTDRGLFTKNAKDIIQKSQENGISMFLAAHSITNIFYILRKEYSVSERKQLLLDLCHTVYIVEAGHDIILKTLENNNFDDFEDSLQAECAAVINADYIITRNIKDFTGSTVPAILPEDFLKLFNETDEVDHEGQPDN